MDYQQSLDKTLSEHIQVGKTGEDITLEYLEKHGFKLIVRNKRYKWGEIDLIVKKNLKIHFVEVKTRRVIRETSQQSVSPEDNLTYYKMKKILRSVEMFLGEMGGQSSCDWQIDLVTVLIIKDKEPRIEIYENIVL